MSRPTDATLSNFFKRAVAEHEASMALVGEVERVLRFGDRCVRLRFAGDALAEAVTRAFLPRVVAADEAPVHATVCLWEESRLPHGASSVPWSDGEVGPRGLVRGASGERVVAVHEAGSLAVTLVDRDARSLLYRVPDASKLPWWERAAPLRPALFWALSEPGRHLVHAGAVGDARRGGVLLAGAGGSGKTTVALAALAAGMAYVADDYVLLHVTPGERGGDVGAGYADGEPVAWNMFATAKLDQGHLARFPQLAAAVTGVADLASEEKAVLDVAALMPASLLPSLPIRAVLVPRIRGGRTRLRRASAAQALLALAPSTAFQMPFDEGQVFASLASLARRVPAFALDVGDEPEELAQAVDSVLDLVAEGADAPNEPLALGATR
ncbi:MAG TPA: hypothetical protein VFY36_03185 [Solirubrobacteraceae bacterium]|nr:hypothetical protein [Solirubrobacteraceae bacterium]